MFLLNIICSFSFYLIRLLFYYTPLFLSLNLLRLLIMLGVFFFFKINYVKKLLTFLKLVNSKIHTPSLFLSTNET